ncbi:LOW QUALITY PROTEIN: hypothetical protein PanWU01x14_156530 [Parasponia andersonii]|uniref:Uncharacterized protein n=1 Tax=Parasponia andersonii TaxID=3476 RepID=A0A2P5CFZ4_PARAD|nr:LOW QUALITY PROTEIN: hypothetical protein PanWU01x14_156530 [Parasponia andersonii]
MITFIAISHGNLLHILVRVTPSQEHVEAQVHRDHGGKQPIELVQPAAVQVLSKPTLPAFFSHVVDDRYQKAAEEIRRPDHTQVKRNPQASHRVGNLVIKVLLQAHREPISETNNQKLRRQPEDTHRLQNIRCGILSSTFEAFSLDQSRNHHCDYRKEHSDPDPLEDVDSSFVSRHPSENRDEKLLVEGDGDYHSDGGEGVNRSRRDLEAIGDLSI